MDLFAEGDHQEPPDAYLMRVRFIEAKEVRMSQQGLKEQFDRDGFVVVRQFLAEDEFQTLQSELRRYIETVVPSLPATSAFYQDPDRPETLKQLQHMGGDPWFRSYTDSPRWKGLAEELLGEEALVRGCEWFNKPVGTNHPTPPHQDNYYFNLTPPSVLTLWLALEDVDEENGCLRYVPGSHLSGCRPHGRSEVLGFSQTILDYGANDAADEVPVTLKANDLVVHHGWAIHRADPNRSATRGRPSFAMVFRGVSTSVDQAGYRRYEESVKSQHETLGLS